MVWTRSTKTLVFCFGCIPFRLTSFLLISEKTVCTTKKCHMFWAIMFLYLSYFFIRQYFQKKPSELPGEKKKAWFNEGRIFHAMNYKIVALLLWVLESPWTAVRVMLLLDVLLGSVYYLLTNKK